MTPTLAPPVPDRLAALRRKAREIRRETLCIHRDAPETRVASSLSAVEIFSTLYYGGHVRVFPGNPLDDRRDRLIVSKGHGSICMYPILADLGFFPREALRTVCREGSFLGGIPDPCIPGYETVNGSLGHGLGVAAGISIALRLRGNPAHVVVICGDGELNEGSMWEAVMFAAHHRLGNLTLIVDNNRRCMLNHTRDVIDLDALAPRFTAFGWKSETLADGHDVAALDERLTAILADPEERPKVLVAQTIKGRGAPTLETDPLAHVQVLSGAQIDELLNGDRDE
jgi:transketolase